MDGVCVRACVCKSVGMCGRGEGRRGAFEELDALRKCSRHQLRPFRTETGLCATGVKSKCKVVSVSECACVCARARGRQREGGASEAAQHLGAAHRHQLRPRHARPGLGPLTARRPFALSTLGGHRRQGLDHVLVGDGHH